MTRRKKNWKRWIRLADLMEQKMQLEEQLMELMEQWESASLELEG